ncbi:MAG: hypothetical protein MJA83_06840, partial [Gammaproteobacteria bacterium]|nr:hypothetical protein [Gammaproteobacteria bacterium]
LDTSRSRPHSEVRLSLQGASRATVNMEVGASLTGDVSGNSLIRYYGDQVVVSVDAYAGGQVVRKGPTR